MISVSCSECGDEGRRGPSLGTIPSICSQCVSQFPWVQFPFVSCGMSFLSCGSEGVCGADAFPSRAAGLGGEGVRVFLVWECFF